MTTNMSNSSRQSNFECLRIVAMMMVVLVHCNYYALSPVRGEDVLNAPVSSFVRILTEQLCFICVNVFILISGWFGLRPTIKGGGALIFQVFFWGALILILGVILNVPLQLKSVLQVFISVRLTGSYLRTYFSIYSLLSSTNSLRTATLILFCNFVLIFRV